MQTNFDEIPGFSKKFRLKRYFNEISPHFCDTIVLICMIFQMITRFARWFTPNFRAIIRSSRKIAAIFQMITRSSQKFHLLFINRLKAFLKHSSLTEIPKWPFQLLAQKKPLICWNSITARQNVSYETHLVISQGTLNCWLESKHQNITVTIIKCTCS